MTTDRYVDGVCDYCLRIIYGAPLRSVTIGNGTSHMCEGCFDKQQARFAEEDDGLPKPQTLEEMYP